MSLAIDHTSYRSPNFDSRKGTQIDTIILHRTEGSLSGALTWLCEEESHVSCHYVIGKDGSCYKIVDLANRAWHAGVARLPANGATNVNSRSVGIELEGYGAEPYPDTQITTLSELLGELRPALPIQYLYAHHDVAPGRKSDPAGLNCRKFAEQFGWIG